MKRDDALVECAKRGDPDAWRELYRSHAGRLVVWLQSRSSSDAALSCEDIASEAWLVAASRVQEFSGSSDEFAGWLFGIARNHVLNLHRRAGRRRTEPDGGVAAGSLLARDDIAAYDGLDAVRRHLAVLPDREREVVACLEVVGLDVAGTAAALGISATAVRVARHRGLKKLRGATT
ncbi:RNA polymerase sigma factor [Nocardioides jiangxiensis]|uniref:Sigma-70 family RNA polymerase sigma factor n=1 Tax=Nocardioides jiangxiensis TaxID=3064524 RepID=A0ABT9AWQ3_9ACTN|nr:sigma-70 family RNA polymerase sigma factor [Nocardioides sp. WY-20]MDO7866900.1 sigma-70 family RNA polymerase sigma factor [Nocardioides sp. WY-20]